MARIGIDIRCLSEGRKTGVEEYVFNLLENVFEMDSKNEYILFLNSFSQKNVNLSVFKRFPNVSLKKLNYPNKILNFFFCFLNWPKINKLIGKIDIFFMPNIAFGSVDQKTKLILTVHDLSFERYPETFSWKRRFWHFFINPRKLCQQASCIIAVSESTKSDLMDIYQVSPEKICVINNGAGKQFQILNKKDHNLFRVKKKYNLPDCFILYLGTIEPRKNIIAIIKAYENFQTNNQEKFNFCKLVIAGSAGWKDREIKKAIFNSKFRNNILFIGFIDDADKVALYNLASIFVYPSLFEGFGFPPVEAMKCGVPIIVSNNSSLPEITGSAAILVDPYKPEEICVAIKNIFYFSEFSQKIKENEIERVKKFNWKKSAQKFLTLIEKLSTSN